MEQIALIEDEADIREFVSIYLRRAGYNVVMASSAEEGIQILSDSISLILLDVMLPGMSGLEMARRLRQSGNNTPIIFMTACTDEEYLLEGFSAGADDYIGKPFSRAELLARIKAVLRRSQIETRNIATCRNLSVNLSARTATVDGEEISLSKKEFEILAFLIQRQGSWFMRSDLLLRIWGEHPCVTERTVDVHIAHIRTKLGESKNLLCSRPGFGYSMIAPTDKEE